MLRYANNFRLIFPLALVLILASIPGVMAQDGQSAAEMYNDALKAQKEGQTEAAVMAYKQVIATDANYINAYLNLGAIYFDQKNYGEALGMFMTASEKDSKNFDALANVGRVQYVLKKYPEAASAFQAALAIDGSKGDVHGELGKTLYRQKNWDGSIAAFEAAHANGGATYETQYYLGKAYQKAGQEAKAVTALQASLQLKNDNYHAQAAIGQIYLGQEKYQLAANAFSAALKIDGSKYQAAYNYAIARQSMNENDDAGNIANWEKFLKVAKGNPKARNQIATAEQTIKALKERLEKKDTQ